MFSHFAYSWGLACYIYFGHFFLILLIEFTHILPIFLFRPHGMLNEGKQVLCEFWSRIIFPASLLFNCFKSFAISVFLSCCQISIFVYIFHCFLWLRSLSLTITELICYGNFLLVSFLWLLFTFNSIIICNFLVLYMMFTFRFYYLAINYSIPLE